MTQGEIYAGPPCGEFKEKCSFLLPSVQSHQIDDALKNYDANCVDALKKDTKTAVLAHGALE